MALGVTDHKFTVTETGETYTFTSNTFERVVNSPEGLHVFITYWLHVADEAALEAARTTLRKLATPRNRMRLHTYPGLRGATLVALDGRNRLGTLESRAASARTLTNVVMFEPVPQRRVTETDGTVHALEEVEFLQLVSDTAD